ncbi:MAG: VWA domain-containing protein, partial [Turicibacter sp.]|nr:VWA domain-containing protein [Turicibacter sp.]
HNLTPQHQTICCFYEIKSLTARVSNTHTIHLVDKSSSMASSLEEVKELIYHTLQILKSNASHRISILLFGNEEDLHWLIFRESAKEVVSQLEEIHCFLEQWFGDEFTHLSKALEFTFRAVEGIKDKRERQQIIIISDGHVYTKNQSLLVEQARCYGWMLDFAMQQIPIYLVGIGDYDLEFLVQLAQTTNLGDFYPYEDLKTYISYFKCWLQLLRTQVNHHLIINNENYFLMSQTLHAHHPKRLPMLAVIPQYIVTFDESLSLNDDLYPVSEEVVSEELKQQFKWAYTYYLLKQKRINEAASLQEDYRLFQFINEGYSYKEISQSLNALNQCRYQKKSRQLNHVNTKQLPSVIQLLEMMLDDPFSNLLWPSSLTISKIVGETHTFETNLNAFFSVKNIKVSTKKQNVTFNVKVEGASRQHENKLKLDCHIYREYFFIKNGNLEQTVLFCQLSPKLKQKINQWCLLLPSCNEKVNVINLSPLKLTHLSLFSLNQDEIMAKNLYELEQLNIRIQVLKTLLKKERLNNNFQSPISLSMRRIRKSYQINASGVFEGETKRRKYIRSD